MRRSILVVCALLAGTTLGCEKWHQIVDRIKNGNRPPTTAARDTTKRTPPANPATGAAAKPPAAGAKATPPAGGKTPPTTTAPSTTPSTTPAPTPPPERAAPEPAPSRPVLADEPYNSADTGTIAPGMSAQAAEALWGAPAALRRAAAHTALPY